jgi:tyrosine-protein kinase Etk/Wzc
VAGQIEQLEERLTDRQSGGAASNASILDIVLVLVRYRRAFLRVTLPIIVLAVVVAVLIPNSYTGVERLMPPKQSTSMATMLLGQLGSFASSAADTLGIHDPNDMYVAMLKSDTIGNRLIKKFDLQKVYRSKTQTDALLRLHERSTIAAGSDSIITIEVTDRDPALAASLAAGYGDELRLLLEELSSDSAMQRRSYYESQLRKAKDDLASAESALRNTQERTGLIDLNEQAKAIIGSVATLRAHVTATEVQLEAMKSYATPNNPDVIRLERRLEAEKAQLARGERSDSVGEGNIQVPTGKVPAVGMEYVRKFRDVKYYETLFELVSKQYEMARLDEASTVSSVQELDRARVPEKKSKPKRSLIILLSTIVSLFFGVASAFVCDAWDRANSNPESAAKIATIRNELYERKWRGHETETHRL